MKKKKAIIATSIIILVIIALLITGICIDKNKEKYIENSNQLYDIASKYILEKDENPDKDKKRYKMFIDYEGFGITEDKEYRYAYMWIYDESFYISNNRIISSGGSSMPYKFTFAKKEDKVIKYENPKDGNEYTSSIKGMFPKDLEEKVLNYKLNDSKLKRDVREYYKDLNNTKIYYTDTMLEVKTKSKSNNKFSLYLKRDNKNVYLQNSIEEVYFYTGETKQTLKKYLTETFQTLDDGLKNVTDLANNSVTVADGGTKVFKSKEYNITIIKCNTKEGVKNIYIGDYKMNFDNSTCK